MHAWGLIDKKTGELAGILAVAWRTRGDARFSKKIRNKSGENLKVVKLEMWVDSRSKEEHS
jgi:hypothetical protein